MMSPTVTFIVPTYNSGHTLKSCIESIRNQDFEDFEVLILDDDSTDNTQNIAARLVSSDRRVRYFQHERTMGNVFTYNEGIRMAAGDLVWFLPSDCTIARTTLLTDFVRAFYRHHQLGFAFCRVQRMDEDYASGQYMPGLDSAKLPSLKGKDRYFEGDEFFKLLLSGNIVSLAGAIARKRCYEEVMDFQPHLGDSAAWFNWLLFSLRTDVGFIPDAAVHCTQLPDMLPMRDPTLEAEQDDVPPAVENAVLCLEETWRYLEENQLPKALRLRTRLAYIRYKQLNHLPLSLEEKTIYSVGKVLSR